MDVAMAASSEEKKIICCCHPKTGTRIVAGLELIMCALVAVLVLAIVVVRMEVDDGEGREDEKADSQANNTSKQTGFALGEGLGKAVGQATAWMIAGIIWIILALASLIILLLLVGNEKERPEFFIPWLVVSWIGFILSVTAILGGIFAGKYGSALGSVGQPVMFAFFLYVVQQRYREVKASSNNRRALQRRPSVYEKVHGEGEWEIPFSGA